MKTKNRHARRRMAGLISLFILGSVATAPAALDSIVASPSALVGDDGQVTLPEEDRLGDRNRFGLAPAGEDPNRVIERERWPGVGDPDKAREDAKKNYEFNEHKIF